MRFGLSDLDELPSLKEFEQLARAALGSDEGIAPIEPETLESMNGADATPSEITDAQAASAPSPQEPQDTSEVVNADADHSRQTKAESAS